MNAPLSSTPDGRMSRPTSTVLAPAKRANAAPTWRAQVGVEFVGDEAADVVGLENGVQRRHCGENLVGAVVQPFPGKRRMRTMSTSTRSESSPTLHRRARRSCVSVTGTSISASRRRSARWNTSMSKAKRSMRATREDRSRGVGTERLEPALRVAVGAEQDGERDEVDDAAAERAEPAGAHERDGLDVAAAADHDVPARFDLVEQLSSSAGS